MSVLQVSAQLIIVIYRHFFCYCYYYYYASALWLFVLQVSAQWIMGAEVKLPPVTIPEGLSEDSKHTLRILSQMVVDCTQFEAQK